MLKGMTVAEASEHTDYIIEVEGDEQLREVWLTSQSGLTFDAYKKKLLTEQRAQAAKPQARPLLPGEEQARLDFAARFVRFNPDKGA